MTIQAPLFTTNLIAAIGELYSHVTTDPDYSTFTAPPSNLVSLVTTWLRAGQENRYLVIRIHLTLSRILSKIYPGHNQDHYQYQLLTPAQLLHYYRGQFSRLWSQVNNNLMMLKYLPSFSSGESSDDTYSLLHLTLVDSILTSSKSQLPSKYLSHLTQGKILSYIFIYEKVCSSYLHLGLLSRLSSGNYTESQVLLLHGYFLPLSKFCRCYMYTDLQSKKSCFVFLFVLINYSMTFSG